MALGGGMEYSTLLFRRHERVAEVTLNRPERLNALNRTLVDELCAVARSIAAEPGIRAVLLTGAGRGFCSGADLLQGDLLSTESGSPGDAVEKSLLEHFNPMMQAWHDLPVPVVVAVNGVAAGAGMSLALVGDVVIAARSATFLQLFAPKVGLMPDLGSTFFLPRMLGSARAKGLALLGEALAAADAAGWGLIWECVDDAELAERARALALRLADGPTQAFKRIKQMFNQQPAATMAEQLAREAIAQTALAGTRDFLEGLQAFADKRPPRFSGQ